MQCPPPSTFPLRPPAVNFRRPTTAVSGLLPSHCRSPYHKPSHNTLNPPAPPINPCRRRCGRQRGRPQRAATLPTSYSSRRTACERVRGALGGGLQPGYWGLQPLLCTSVCMSSYSSPRTACERLRGSPWGVCTCSCRASAHACICVCMFMGVCVCGRVNNRPSSKHAKRQQSVTHCLCLCRPHRAARHRPAPAGGALGQPRPAALAHTGGQHTQAVVKGRWRAGQAPRKPPFAQGKCGMPACHARQMRKQPAWCTAASDPLCCRTGPPPAARHPDRREQGGGGRLRGRRGGGGSVRGGGGGRRGGPKGPGSHMQDGVN